MGVGVGDAVALTVGVTVGLMVALTVVVTVGVAVPFADAGECTTTVNASENRSDIRISAIVDLLLRFTVNFPLQSFFGVIPCSYRDPFCNSNTNKMDYSPYKYI